ncbi:TRAP transporter small permease [bacterium]|nr:TRAP transporter small permease [bacterium]
MSAEPERPVPFVLRPLRAADGFVRRIEVTVLVLVVLTMIGLSFAQVATRILRPYIPIFQPVAWFDILARHLVLWVGVLGASVAAREGRHFGVEALPKLFSERGRRRLEGFLNLVAGIVTALLTRIMWNKIVLDEIPRSGPPEYHHLFTVGLPGGGTLPVDEWWLLGIIPIGLAGMTFRFFLRSLEAGLLTDGEWHQLERELKPDLVAAPDPAADPASMGSGAVVEASTPPAVAEKQEAQAHAQPKDPPAPPPPPVAPPAAPPAPPPAPAATTPPSSPLWTPVPRVVSEQGKKVSTEKVKRRAVADAGDVQDPEPQPGDENPRDTMAELVDSSVSLTEPESEEGPPPAGSTERQPADPIDPSVFDSTADGEAPSPAPPDKAGPP